MRATARRWWGMVVALACVAAPGAARACSVCSAADEGAVRSAFLATTILLSVLPLLLVGGFAWWLRRRTRALEAATPRQPAPGTRL